MLDSLEFSLITECYNNPDIDFTIASGGVSHQIALDTYNHNIQKDISESWRRNWNNLYRFLWFAPDTKAGFMTLRHGFNSHPSGSFHVVQAIDLSLNIRVNIINPTNYQFLPQYF